MTYGIFWISSGPLADFESVQALVQDGWEPISLAATGREHEKDQLYVLARRPATKRPAPKAAGSFRGPWWVLGTLLAGLTLGFLACALSPLLLL